MEDIYSFAKSLPAHPNKCASQCETARYCYSALYVDDYSLKTGVRPSSALVEAENIISEIHDEDRAPIDEERYRRWRERIATRFAGRPAELARALEFVDEMENGQRETHEKIIEIRQATLDATVALEEELARNREIYEAVINLRDERECPGPIELTVGRFASRKTVKVCSLQEEPEFVRAEELKAYQDSLLFMDKFKRRILGED